MTAAGEAPYIRTMAFAPLALRLPTASLRPRRRGARSVYVVALALICCTVLQATSSGWAYAETAGEADRPSRRAGWATLLVLYTGLGAAATGAAYLTRDNFAGRAIAGAAGAWGGGSVGAGAAYALSHLVPCRTRDCEEERAGPVFLGALLGGLAGSLLASWQTSEPGMSRPKVTALGMTPFFIYASLGTILDW